jgi:hypothetical protein
LCAYLDFAAIVDSCPASNDILQAGKRKRFPRFAVSCRDSKCDTRFVVPKSAAKRHTFSCPPIRRWLPSFSMKFGTRVNGVIAMIVESGPIVRIFRL